MAAQTVPNRTAHNHSTDGTGQPSGQNGDVPAGARKQNGEHATPSWDQTPQLLQWRANVLLDEMMLGAVDITANEFTHAAPAQPRADRNSVAVDQPVAAPYRDERSPSRTAALPEAARDAPRTARAYTDDSRREDEQPAIGDAHEDRMQPTSDPQDEWARPAWHFAEPTIAGPSLSPPPNTTPAARAAILQEYTRAQTKPTDSAKSGRPNGASVRPTQPTLPNGTTAKHNAEQWVLAAEQRYQKIAAQPSSTSERDLTGSMDAASLSAASWVDPTDALFEDFPATSVSSQASKRCLLVMNRASVRFICCKKPIRCYKLMHPVPPR